MKPKRILALFLSLVMILSLVPSQLMTVFAGDEGKGTLTKNDFKCSDLTQSYDGHEKSATVEYISSVTPDWRGEITVTYKQGDTVVEAPADAGSYDIYVSTEGTDGYEPLSETKLDQTLTVEKAAIPDNMITSQSIPAGTAFKGYSFDCTIKGVNEETIPGTVTITSEEDSEGNTTATVGTTHSGLQWKFTSDADVAKNYILPHTGTSAASLVGAKIKLKPVITAEDKVYDKTPATVTVSGMDPLVLGTDYRFMYKDGGAEQTRGFSAAGDTYSVRVELLSDYAKANYELEDPNYCVAYKITKKPFTFSNISGLTKVYDGTKTAPEALTEDAFREAAIGGYAEGETTRFSFSFTAEYDSTDTDATKIIITNIQARNPEIDGCYEMPEKVEMPAIITPKGLTVQPLNNTIEKVYDGTTKATLTEDTNYTVTGMLEGDTPTVVCEAEYDNKKVGENKGVIASFTMGSDSVSKNYTISLGNTALYSSGKITPYTINYTTPVVFSNVPVGTLFSDLKLNNVKLNGANSEEITGDITVSAPSTTASVEENGYYTGLPWVFTPSSTDEQKMANYNNVSGNNAMVVAKIPTSIDVELMSQTTTYNAQNQAYSGNVIAKNNSTWDNITLKSSEYTIGYKKAGESAVSYDAPKNVGTYTVVFELTEAGAAKYKLSGEATALYTIKQAELSIENTEKITKTYDGTANAENVTTSILKLVGNTYSDTVGIIADPSYSVVYDNPNVGENKSVTVTGIQLDDANYTFAEGALTGLKGDIKAKDVAISGAPGKKVTKSYDGTTNAATSAITADYFKLSGVIEADKNDVTPDLTDITASFSNANAMTGNVNVLGVKIKGAKAGNYNLTTGSVELTGEITKADYTSHTPVAIREVEIGTDFTTIEIDGITAYGVTVNGETEEVTGKAKITSEGSVVADGSYTLNWTFVPDANQEEVTANYNNLTGSDASVTGKAKTKLTPVINATDKKYDGQMSQVTVSGMEPLTLGTDYELNYVRDGIPCTGAMLAGEYVITVELKGDYVKARYELTDPAYSKTLTISKIPITFNNISDLTKVYDGTKTAPEALTSSALESVATGYVTGEISALSFTFDAEYDSKDTSATKIVITNIHGHNTAIEGCYEMPERVEMPASITPATLTVGKSVSTISKVYDGTTEADVANTVTLTGEKDDDVPTLLAYSGEFNSKNVADATTVRVSGLALDDRNAINKNYRLDKTEVTYTGVISEANLVPPTKIEALNVSIGTTIIGYTIPVTVKGKNNEEIKGKAQISAVPANVTDTLVAPATEYDGLTWTFIADDDADTTALMANYDDTLGGTNAKLKGKELATASLEIENKTYDAKAVVPKTVAVSNLDDGDWELQYSEDGIAWAKTAPIAAGVYSARIVLLNGKEATHELGGTTTASFTITPERVNSVITLTAPVKNEKPQLSIETDEYTANVVWSPEIAEGGTFAKSTEYTAKITITLKDTTNYTFDGIAENGYTLDGATSVTNEAGSNVVTAVFPRTGSSSSSSSSYTVQFNTNGGNTITSQTVKKNNTVAEPTAPTKDGYIFDGWYTDSKFANEYDFDTKVTKNITLYAKWVEEEAQNPSDDTNDKKDDNSDNTDDNKPTTDDWKNPFDDVKDNEWYFDNVKYANENGLMSGTTDTTFAPNDNLTRGMLVTVLYRAEGEPAVNKSIPFADVNASQYYANAVIWAQQNSIVKGVSETEFAPNENITREQIATIIYRYAEYKGYDVTQGGMQIREFEDFESISDYAINAMTWAVNTGLMKGKTNTTLNPKDNATRAEIAAILGRFIESNK